VADLLADLDRLLFEDRTWYCLDAANQRVRHQRPVTFEQALALVGRGRVATFAGQLRPEVIAVDIDLPAKLGTFLLEELRAWCRERRLWHLARPSGRGAGHAHLYVLPGVRHREDFIEHVKAHRAERRLKTSKLDLRTGGLLLRPLSAPHRKGAAARLDDDVAAAALMELREVLDLMPATQRTRAAVAGARRADRAPSTSNVIRSVTTALRPSAAERERTQELPIAPLQPLTRSRRALPEQWQVYLAAGPGAPGGPAQSDDRSEMELKATFQLVITGHDEDAAWQRIQQAHPHAFAKSRARGRCWWWLLWNKAVSAADAWLSARRSTGQPPVAVEARFATRSPASPRCRADEGLRSILLRAHAALMEQWLDWPPQTRHTDREMFEVLLDRMSRKGSVSIPVPQRDLVLDCAVASRHTVRRSLERLQGYGLVRVDETYRVGTTDSSHTVALVGGPERAGAEGPGAGVSGVAPPWFHTPLPLRRSLTLPTTHLLQVLRSSTRPSPLAPLARDAGLLLLSPSQRAAGDRLELTTAQRRTAARHLNRLLEHGLAITDENGNWAATAAAVALSGHQRSVAAQTLPDAASALWVRGEQQQEVLRAAVAAERAEFRARLDPDARRLRWQAARQAALARQEKLAITRRKAWWDGLSPNEREQRRAVYSDAFRALPAEQQLQRRQTLASRRGVTTLGPTAGQGYSSFTATAAGPVLSARAEKVLHRWSPRDVQISPGSTITAGAASTVGDGSTGVVNPVAAHHSPDVRTVADRSEAVGADQDIVLDLRDDVVVPGTSWLAPNAAPVELELDLQLDVLRPPSERYFAPLAAGFIAP
jgi:hypothetical protein